MLKQTLFGLVLLLAPACSENLSTKGQLIECTPGASGPNDCHPTSSPTPNAGKCTDVDEDGDGDDHDEAEAEEDDLTGTTRMATNDDDDDGTADDMDPDDDNDGIPDTDDCDETEGGDDAD